MRGVDRVEKHPIKNGFRDYNACCFVGDSSMYSTPARSNISRSSTVVMKTAAPVPVEKAKPFRLVKYFTFTSIVVIFLGTIILSVLNTHWARKLQRQKSEEYAHVLIENLNHQIFLRFIVPVAIKYGRVKLREQEQYELLDQVVRGTLHSFKVEVVNIFDMENVVVYSFDRELIGTKGLGGAGYQKASEGKSNSNLIQRGNFWESLLGFYKESRLVTIAPLRAEKQLITARGPVLGVVEIVQDLSEDYKTIFNFQISVITTSTVVMSLLFVVLIFVVKRGENIIQRRAVEQRRLEEQLSLAERLTSMGEMAAGISHEIRNPLGIIRNSAELLKKKMAKFDPSNNIPTVIVEETSRLNNIVTDFINYAKPKSPNLEPSRVQEIVERGVKFLQAQMSEIGCRTHIRIEKDIPDIPADSSMLYQAFFNILINSMQSMTDGGEIRIAIDSNEHNVRIVFDDDGKGIPEDVLDKIWEPFYTTKEKGTGLGLGIVKNIIEAHSGRIQIANKPDKGVQVIVELPIGKEVKSWKPS